MTITIPQVRHIVSLANAQSEADVRWSRNHPDGVSYESLPEEDTLIQAIDDLPREQQIELQALAWLGRGDYTTFADALEHSRARAESVSTYLAEKSPLSEYLSAGVLLLLRRA